MKRTLLSLFIMSSGLFAQEVNYYFEQFTSTYNNLEDPISLSNNIIWDDPEYLLQLDFDFNLLGNSLTQLNFGPGVGGNLYNGDMSYALFPISADIADRAFNIYLDNEDELGGLSPISYKVIGEEGSHILKIEWNNVGFYEDESNNYYMNFQLWLYEGSDMIEVHYGPSDVPDNFFTLEENACGFFAVDFNTETGSGFILEEVNENYDFGFNYLDENWEPNSFESVPENGTVFRFYPEYAVEIEELVTVINTYPNPVKEILFIENSKQTYITYQIMSLDGRILGEGNSYDSKVQIDMTKLNSGVYLLSFLSNGYHLKKSFIKQ